MDTDIAIIGAGHNGLVTAFYLARAGFSVDLFERRPFSGGAAITEELWPGYFFSTCAHMTHAIHPKIMGDLGMRERGFETLPWGPGIQIRRDGTYWGPHDHESPRNHGAAGRLTEDERQGMRELGEFGHALRCMFEPYRLRLPPSLEEVRAAVAGTANAEILETALSTGLMELHDRLLPTELLRDHMVSAISPVARNPLALHVAYGSIGMPDSETGEAPPYGYVRGGMGETSRIMAEAAKEAGAQIHVDSGVERILVEDGAAVGICLEDGTEVHSRVVVSNLDPKRTFLKLTAAEHLTDAFIQRVTGITTDVSCYKFLAVVSELPQWTDWDGDPELPSLGSVRIGSSCAEVIACYDDLEAGRPPRRPVVSLSIPSAVDPSLADGNGHTISAWVYPAPSTLSGGTTWDDVREDVTEAIIDQITEFAPNFRASVRKRKLRTPLDLERENGLTGGCIWHVSHDGRELFWNRPLPELAHYRAPLSGMYMCGAGQHPGGEVSGIPGHNAAHEILKDLA